MDGEKAELLFKNDVIEVSVVNYGYQLISKVDHMSNAVASGRGPERRIGLMLHLVFTSRPP